MKNLMFLFALISTITLVSCTNCPPPHADEEAKINDLLSDTTNISDENKTWITGEGDTIVE